jgi:hypothetical protein
LSALASVRILTGNGSAQPSTGATQQKQVAATKPQDQRPSHFAAHGTYQILAVDDELVNLQVGLTCVDQRVRGPATTAECQACVCCLPAMSSMIKNGMMTHASPPPGTGDRGAAQPDGLQDAADGLGHGNAGAHQNLPGGACPVQAMHLRNA